MSAVHRHEREKPSTSVDPATATEVQVAGDEVTAVVVTRNRAEHLVATLAHLDGVARNIIVVDNASTDGTSEHARRQYPSVRVVRLPENRGAAARTVGVREALTAFVAFSDDDSWWESGSLERGVSALRSDPRLGLVAARVLVGPLRRLDPVSRVMRHSPLSPVSGVAGRRVLGFVACAAICRRDAYLACGGFHPRYGIGGEEALLAVDLAVNGYSCAYLDDVVAYHHPARAADGRPDARRLRMTARNDMWTSWLRLPLRVALARTAGIARGPQGPSALISALRGVGWVARERRPVDPRLVHELELLRLSDGGREPSTSGGD
jgi:GT2 family glycosyltransferase